VRMSQRMLNYVTRLFSDPRASFAQQYASHRSSADTHLRSTPACSASTRLPHPLRTPTAVPMHAAHENAEWRCCLIDAAAVETGSIKSKQQRVMGEMGGCPQAPS
jgi:hypothetical protein